VFSIKLELEIKKGTVLKAILVIALLFGAFFSGALLTAPTAFKKGFEKGYLKALTDISELTGLEFEWEDLGNGSYKVTIRHREGLYTKSIVKINCEIVHKDASGNLISRTYHPGVLVDQGKEWIEDKLSGNNAARWGLNGTYISVSNDSSAVSTTWTIIPNEITTNGLARARGSYVSTGIGAWNISHTFSVTGTNSTKLYGLNYDSGTSATLICAEQQGLANQKNVASGDTLRVTWQISVS